MARQTWQKIIKDKLGEDIVTMHGSFDVPGTPAQGEAPDEVVEEIRAAGRAYDKARRTEVRARDRLIDALGAGFDADMPTQVLVWASGWTRQHIYQLRQQRESRRQRASKNGDDDDAS